MKTIRIFTIAVIAFACLSISARANVTAIGASVAGKTDHSRLRWKGKTVKIAVSSSLTRFSPNIKADSDVVGAVRRSLEVWSNAAGIDLELEISDRQNVSPSGVAGDGTSLISIAQTPENVLFFAKDHDLASAKTRIFFNRKGFITEADIVLNPFQQFSTDGTFGTFDLESTLTHEVGHLLGLQHLGVLGATMAASFARNGSMGVADNSPRTLAESDVSAIRDLYGAPNGVEDCCAVISGKLINGAGGHGKELQVWAEESQTGRVMAEADAGTDGLFRLGGLSSGDYSVYWKTIAGSDAPAMGEIGAIRLETGENKRLNEKIVLLQSEANVAYIGRNGQLADHGIHLSAGRTSTISIGGKNLDDEQISLTVSSPEIRVSLLPGTAQEFGGGVSGISFMVTVDAEIKPGNYSIFVNGRNGSVSCLVGALSIE